MTNILSYGAQSVYLYSSILTQNMQNIQAGSEIDITLTYTVMNLNNNSPFTVSATVSLFISQSPLQPIGYVYATNKSILVNNTVSFLEQMMILNGSSSYDPDNSSANLSYSWQCPSIV